MTDLSKVFRRMTVVVPTSLSWNEMRFEASEAAAARMAPHGLRPGVPKIVGFKTIHGLQYAQFKVRAWPTLRSIRKGVEA